MDLAPYVEYLRDELATAAEARGEEAAAAARRLAGPLEPAVRLMLLDVLSAAADEITSELAPGSAELRLRSGEPEFAVTAAPDPPRGEPEPETVAPPEGDERAPARINLRLPEQLKAGVELAAARERLSVNAWLVRVVAAAVTQDGPAPHPSGRPTARSYTGWVR